MHSVFRPFVRLAALAALLGVACAGALAQSPAWPMRQVTIVVPYPAGGGTDAIARSLALALSARWGQSVVVENPAGGDGIIGTQRVLRTPPDGYTILMQVNQMLLYKAAQPNLNLMDDLKLVSMVQHSPLSFSVSTKFPGKTIAEFVAYCKTAKPACSWASATKYGQLIGNQFIDAAGLKGLVINAPYKGTAPMMTDLLGGHITMALPAVASGLPHYKSGGLRFLAVGSAERFKLMPNIPTLVESGYQVFGDSWYGLMVSKDTPQPVFNAIVEAVKAVSTNPALLASIESNAGQPVFSSPERFAADVAKESAYLNGLLTKYPLDPN